MTGSLYVVATPLGNLEDLSPRAVAVLKAVALIAAEDTRHSQVLCQYWGIQTQRISLHDHNERERIGRLIARLQAGESVAVISDAGTPLISDPGYLLIRAAREAAVPVYAVAGPSAITAALSVAGVPCDRFVFEGFPPAQSGPRKAFFVSLAGELRTIVFYESPHRLADAVADLRDIFGGDREVALVREITKRFEEGILTTLGDLACRLQEHPVKGECVLIVRGAQAPDDEVEGLRVVEILLETLPLRQAVDLAVSITGAPRKPLYARALALKGP